jgi:hypothetical protein
MIARIWRGVVRLEDADEYADYVRDTGFAEYAETSGNRGDWMLRRDQGDRTEFITVSLSHQGLLPRARQIPKPGLSG